MSAIGGGNGALPGPWSSPSSPPAQPRRPSRYESQKRRDWQTFTRYLAAHRPPLELCHCSGAHVLEFLRYLDRFGKTRVHAPSCPSYGGGANGNRPPDPAAAAAPPCGCPLRQAWGSLDALVGRLRAAFEERHGARGGIIWSTPSPSPSSSNLQQQDVSGGDGGAAANPFAARAVRLYLRDVRDAQSRARGISYSRKKKKRPSNKQQQQHDGGSGRARGGHVNVMSAGGAAAPPPALISAPAPPPMPMQAAAAAAAPYYLNGLPFEFCDYGGGGGGVLGGGGVTANGAPGFYLPSLFNTFG